jgi:hypothetical protein
MAALTPITQVGNIKYFICDTYSNLATQKPNWSGARCRLDDGTWYEYREFTDNMGGGSWEVFTGETIALAIGTGAITESNPLPIKTSLLSGTQVTVFDAISATPVTPYTLVLAGTNIKEVKLFTMGTSTSRTMTFKANRVSGAEMKPFMGVNFSDVNNTLATSTTGKDEIWSFSGLDGIYSLQFNVTAIAGGNFSVMAVTLL